MSTPMYSVTHSTNDFDAIRLKLASPDKIREWSYGEVLRPETINYRTQKPEKDGLFCEKIFGPSKDWECYCGKYKKIRYKGLTCDKCGVEVTRASVRRERMGHIDLAAPVSHIWFLRGVPSKIGLVLNLPPQALEKVIYFANFIITDVNEEIKQSTLEQLKQEAADQQQTIENNFKEKEKSAKEGLKDDPAKLDEAYATIAAEKDGALLELKKQVDMTEKEIRDVAKLKIISEHDYQELSLKYGPMFEAGIGAEAIHQLLGEVDLTAEVEALEAAKAESQGPKKEKIVKRLRLVRSLEQNMLNPQWMIMTAIPIIPPDLRPMVALDGGRFATSDLNDLYRRVINRNNRLKRLLELNAPEVIVRNEKRMLQEAVDALIDNSARHSKTVMASTGQKRQLKSIADILKGKQGRFRQNLLGKRTDYSGRSVIVVGPNLKLYQCGLPKKMALELFKPFVISRLIKEGYVHNIRSANRFIESDRAEVWDILEDVTKHAHVMLNRAPTLHRLGIQAFQPVLIEGKAIQLHPLTCSAYNADFDGDQMAVHVPLTEQAKSEAANIMLAAHNLLKPSDGRPVVKPSKDVILGLYYLTHQLADQGEEQTVRAFSSIEEARTAYQLRQITLHETIKVKDAFNGPDEKEVVVETTMGRIIFNSIVPAGQPYYNDTVDSKRISQIIANIIEATDLESSIDFLDDIKTLGYKYLTKSGWSWGMDDLPLLTDRMELIEAGEKLAGETEDQFQQGLLTEKERHSKVVEIWTGVKDQITDMAAKSLNPNGPVNAMISSGARGTLGQLTQMIGMKGPVANPAGEIIELPVKGNFKEGFGVLELFISSHGSRKGLADTALRTASAGYLTRRLVDVVQDVVIKAHDCGDTTGAILLKDESAEMGQTIAERAWGRASLQTIKDADGNIICKKNQIIDDKIKQQIEELDPDELHVRSVMSCRLRKGICQKCYGFDLGYNQPVTLGSAVGIIAAQSIGEPGTQLTMRTFHTGGVAGKDITQGLPRVEELFEARQPKHKAFVSEVDGAVKIEEMARTITDPSGKVVLSGKFGQKVIRVSYEEIEEDTYRITKNATVKVKDGDSVTADQLLMETPAKETLAKRAGIVKIDKSTMKVVVQEQKADEYIIPSEYSIVVKDGDLVTKGDRLTDGSLNLQSLFRHKGEEAVQKYMLREVQRIYSSQGQRLNDKHVEIIIRQLFSRVMVKDAGDTDLLPGEVSEKSEVLEANDKAEQEGKELATYDPLFLGISKVSLSTASWLSAASFQETARVLIDAAVTGKVDKLEGLKENVIIGRRIPAGTGFDPEEHGSA